MSDKIGICVCCGLTWRKGGTRGNEPLRWGYCSTCLVCAGPTSASWRRRDRIINWLVRWLFNLRSENNERA